jgi:hypothetical protein
MQEPHEKGVANHLDPESCAGAGSRVGEALTGAHAGEPSRCDTEGATKCNHLPWPWALPAPAFAVWPSAATGTTIAERNEKKRKRGKHRFLTSPLFLRLLSFLSALFSCLLSVSLVRKTRCCAFAAQARHSCTGPSFQEWQRKVWPPDKCRLSFAIHETYRGLKASYRMSPVLAGGPPMRRGRGLGVADCGLRNPECGLKDRRNGGHAGLDPAVQYSSIPTLTLGNAGNPGQPAGGQIVQNEPNFGTWSGGGER